MVVKHVVRKVDAGKHGAILQAASSLFLEYGYSKASMDAIAQEACVTKQTVYAHYKSKEGLFTHMMTELLKKHTPPGIIVKGKAQPVEKILSVIARTLLDMITSKEGLALTRLVVTEAQRHPKLARYYYESGSRKTIMILVDCLNRENDRGTLKIPNTLSAASYFFSMLKGNYYIRILLNIRPHPSLEEKEAHVKETVAIFMRLYGGNKPMHTRNAL